MVYPDLNLAQLSILIGIINYTVSTGIINNSRQPDLSYPNTCTLADTVYVYRASNFVFEKDPHPLDAGFQVDHRLRFS
jgi:hypothetical protein